MLGNYLVASRVVLSSIELVSLVLVKRYPLQPKNSLILYGLRKNCLISGRSLLLYQFTKRVKKSECNNYRGISLLSTSYKILSNVLSRLLEIINVDFNITDQLLIILSAFVR
jgi:hypothetical protein